jgi:hypothetical protein
VEDGLHTFTRLDAYNTSLYIVVTNRTLQLFLSKLRLAKPRLVSADCSTVGRTGPKFKQKVISLQLLRRQGHWKSVHYARSYVRSQGQMLLCMRTFQLTWAKVWQCRESLSLMQTLSEEPELPNRGIFLFRR